MGLSACRLICGWCHVLGWLACGPGGSSGEEEGCSSWRWVRHDVSVGLQASGSWCSFGGPDLPLDQTADDHASTGREGGANRQGPSGWLADALLAVSPLSVCARGCHRLRVASSAARRGGAGPALALAAPAQPSPLRSLGPYHRPPLLPRTASQRGGRPPLVIAAVPGRAEPEPPPGSRHPRPAAHPSRQDEHHPPTACLPLEG